MTWGVSIGPKTLYNSSDCDVPQLSRKNHKKNKEGGKHGSAIIQKNMISYRSEVLPTYTFLVPIYFMYKAADAVKKRRSGVC